MFENPPARRTNEQRESRAGPAGGGEPRAPRREGLRAAGVQRRRRGGDLPINYHAAGREITFRTAPGTKLAGSLIAGRAVFEVDDVAEDEVWSVIVRGPVRTLENEAEIDAAEELDLRPFVPTVKRFFVRLDADEVSGRRFRRGPEPEAPLDAPD